MPRKLSRLVTVLIGAAFVLAACSRQAAVPRAEPVQHDFSRKPAVANYSLMKSQPINLAKPTSNANPFAVDLRQHDMSKTDLSQAADVLLGYASFDTETVWPATLPTGYDPKQIMKLGKDPGLGVRKLHQQGITGKGIRVAFLDQSLLVDHEEYKDRVAWYREIGPVASEAAMHGAAVCSILAGKTVGVAPDVAVTYYAIGNVVDGNPTWANHPQAIYEILDANAKLPPAQRIRVIGVSWGFSPTANGYNEIKAAIARAKQDGVFVITTSVDADYTFKFHGLGRDPLADPNDVNAYRPGSWWADQYYADPDAFKDRILVPMDSRTTAAPTGLSSYAFYRDGGWSWVVPYLEGMYALGLQVKPDLMPEEFYRAALDTGSYSQFTKDGKSYKLGPILNPVALIERLKGN